VQGRTKANRVEFGDGFSKKALLGEPEEVEMAEATNHAAHPEGDEDLKRAVIENLDALDREGKLAVLDFSRRLNRGEHRPNVAAISLLDEWMADDSGYDEETWPELKEALDRNRREAGQYRKLFES
jgi:hypothetical protein